MAMDHTVWILNHLPAPPNVLSAKEMFLGEKVATHSSLCHVHIWGCMAYVLDPRLQDRKKIPNFYPCSCRGQFLRFLKEHSLSVTLVLNCCTGKITSQFHCVLFDDYFQTVHGIDGRHNI